MLIRGLSLLEDHPTIVGACRMNPTKVVGGRRRHDEETMLLQLVGRSPPYRVYRAWLRTSRFSAYRCEPRGSSRAPREGPIGLQSSPIFEPTRRHTALAICIAIGGRLKRHGRVQSDQAITDVQRPSSGSKLSLERERGNGWWALFHLFVGGRIESVNMDGSIILVVG